ncbi:MAG: polysaccharide lyase 6 family protein [Planctomycetales bacterium]|nr:polysaccharide lyase 6 family protein [Planctomycetales bacterium]
MKKHGSRGTSPPPSHPHCPGAATAVEDGMMKRLGRDHWALRARSMHQPGAGRRGSLSSLFTALALLQLAATPAVAKEFLVKDVHELKLAAKSARPGDHVIMAEGEWRDAKLVFSGQGTKAAPITLRAAAPGKTVMTGASELRLGGENLVVDGLLFQNPAATVSDLIQFRVDSKRLAFNCRLTNCAVISTLQVENSQESRWVNLYGSGHRVDRCTFQGKSGKGSTLVVWLVNTGDGRHQIEQNYFGPREKLGKNGGETIRIGDSKTSMLAGDCVVENNLFERCNGETECISNKSCGNTYRHNTFLEVSGTLTLRHGNDCLVEQNVFLGNKARGTGGVRIIGEDHIVRGNYFEKLTGDDARSALTFMMGIPNSPADRYFQVQRAIVQDNTFVECEHTLLIGLSDDRKATLPPIETVITGNVVVAEKYTVVEARCPLDGITWKQNHFFGKDLGMPPVAGVETDNAMVAPLPPVSRALVGVSWRAKLPASMKVRPRSRRKPP